MTGKPLYDFLGGAKKQMETDLTIGIGSPEMANRQSNLKERGTHHKNQTGQKSKKILKG